jgi:sec-independent protein translocase protein TatA
VGEFSLWHWLVVAVIGLLVFGAKRLPEMGASLGKGIREFKRSMSEIGDVAADDRTPLPRPDVGARMPESREPKRLSQ